MFKRILLTMLTTVVLSLMLAPASQALDLDKAIVIGNGPKKVIEFTDPDCPFCRKASTYFKNRDDVTRYVFFTPLKIHPNARQKIQYILSAGQNDRVRLYNEVMSGKVDRMDFDKLPITPAGVKLQKEQQAETERAKVDSTPTFMIMGRIIEGFDLRKIEELLGN